MYSVDILGATERTLQQSVGHQCLPSERGLF